MSDTTIQKIQPNEDVKKASNFGLRRTVRVVVAVLCLMFIPIWKSYFVQRFLKMSSDFSYTAETVSVENLYDFERKTFSGDQYSQSRLSYKTKGFRDGAQIIETTFDVRTIEGVPIFSVSRDYFIDPLTGAHAGVSNQIKRNGYLFAPRGLKPGEGFTYWHVSQDLPANMKFVGAEKLYGLEVYKYRSDYGGEPIEQTEGHEFLPGVPNERGLKVKPIIELWVEPVSGYLVKLKDGADDYYFYDKKTGERLNPWNRFSNTFSEKEIRSNAHNAVIQKVKIFAVSLFVPLLLLLLSFYLLLPRGWEKKVFISKVNNFLYLLALSGLIVVPIIVLVGWQIGWDVLVQFIPGQNAMNPLTAICFLLLAVIIILKKLDYGVLTKLFAVILFVTASVRLFNYFGILNFSPDLVLFVEKTTLLGVTSRMSLFTSVNFFLVSLAVLLSTNGKGARARVTEAVIVFVYILSFFALCGFEARLFGFETVFAFVSAAIQTICLFILSSFLLFFTFRSPNNLHLPIRKNGIIFTVLTIGALVAFTSSLFTEFILKEQISKRFFGESKRISELFNNGILSYAVTLESAKGLFQASNEVKIDQWKKYVDTIHLRKHYPSILSIGYFDIIPKDRLNSKPKLPGASDSGQNIGDSAKVTFAQPSSIENEMLVGYDFYADSQIKSVLERSRDDDEPATINVAGVRNLSREFTNSFIMVDPVYSVLNIDADVATRRSSNIGFVFIIFKLEQYIKNAIVSYLDGFYFKVYSGTKIKESNLVYSSVNMVAGTNAPQNSDLYEIQVVQTHGSPWTIVFWGDQKFGDAEVIKVIIAIIALVALALTMLSVFVLYAVFSSEQKAILYSEEVNSQLISGNENLVQKNAEIGEKIKELEKLNSMMIGRELAMVEMKKKLKKYESESK